MSGSTPFFFCLRCLSQTIFTTRAFNVLRQHPTPTTIFMLPILLLLAFSFYRTTHNLGLGVSCLSCIQNWYSCNDRRLPRLPELQQRRRSKKQRSVTPRTSVATAPVDESARETASSLPARLHKMGGPASTGQWPCRDGCVRDFREPQKVCDKFL